MKRANSVRRIALLVVTPVFICACSRVSPEDEAWRTPSVTIEPVIDEAAGSKLPASVEEAVGVAAARGKPLRHCPAVAYSLEQARGC
jgi:hypothetical protein